MFNTRTLLHPNFGGHDRGTDSCFKDGERGFFFSSFLPPVEPRRLEVGEVGGERWSLPEATVERRPGDEEDFSFRIGLSSPNSRGLEPKEWDDPREGADSSRGPSLDLLPEELEVVPLILDDLSEEDDFFSLF